MRHIASDLRAAILDVLGLPAAVSWQLSEFETHTGLAVKLDMPEDLACPPELAIVCFRILQELLTNVTRHAEAAAVQVRLRQTHHKLFMEVRDDGSGIHAADISRSTSLGLLGIRERVQQFGGVFQVGPAQPHGTVATVEMPLESN